jgi:hypothetical protein
MRAPFPSVTMNMQMQRMQQQLGSAAGKRASKAHTVAAKRAATVRVLAVAAPERVSLKGVQRPDPTGRFGKWVDLLQQ